MTSPQDQQALSDQPVAGLRGSTTYAVGATRLERAVELLQELHRRGADRPREAYEVVRLMHDVNDPRAERWLVRLIARLIVLRDMDLEGLLELADLAEAFRVGERADRQRLREICQPTPEEDAVILRRMGLRG